jgi:glycosyltransferase involved in cell wall biosynthesis
VRIAFFADSYKPYLSGVTNAIDVLAKELRHLGHKVYIFAPFYPHYTETDPDVIRFPSFAGGYPKFRLAIPYVKNFPDVDLIHSHTPFQSGLLARYLARQRQLPFVYSFHTLFTRYVHYARFVPKELAKMGIVAYLRSFCHGADQIITPSDMAKRVLRAWQVKTPITVVPSGVELHNYPKDPLAMREVLRLKLSIPLAAKVLLYVGRISEEKNIPFLLKVLERITEPNLRLVLVGGGPLAKGLIKHHDRRLILTGEIPYPEILHYYSLGDLFLFSSLTETQGLVLAEAKAAGLPIVAQFAGGLTGTIRSGIDGYLVKRDLKTYVHHVKRLLADDQLSREMSSAALADVRERFAASVVAKQIESVYNSLNKSREA